MKIVRPISFVCCLCWSVFVAPTTIKAQSVGDHLRVTLMEGSISGTVVSVSGSGFELGLSGDRIRLVPFGTIRKLERRMGTRSYWKEGLLYGAGAGVVVGVVIGRLTHETCDLLTIGTGDEFCDEFGVRAGIVSAALWGGVLGTGGLIIGALIRRQEWMAIAVPTATGHLRVTPWIDVSLREGEAPMVFTGASFSF